jgi:hypothetical protein
MKPILSTLAALAVLLSLSACHGRAAAQGSPMVSAALPGAAILPEPLPADLPPTPAPAAARPSPEPPPSAEELAAFHAPVPK